MITFHSLVIRWSSRFNRWYAYDSIGNLIYLDFSFCSAVPDVSSNSGHPFEILGKIQRPARIVEGGPLFTVIVAAFTPEDLPVPSDAEVPIL